METATSATFWKKKYESGNFIETATSAIFGKKYGSGIFLLKWPHRQFLEKIMEVAFFMETATSAIFGKNYGSGIFYGNGSSAIFGKNYGSGIFLWKTATSAIFGLDYEESAFMEIFTITYFEYFSSFRPLTIAIFCLSSLQHFCGNSMTTTNTNINKY